MRITLAQLDSDSNVGRNLDRMDEMAANAARDGARMIVFPEYAMYEKPRVDSSFAAVAEPVDGPVAGRFADIAKRHQLVLVAGFIESSDEPGRAYNTILAIGPDGKRLALYRKIHLFDSQGFQESLHIKPATDLRPVTFDVGGTVFGILTCYDLRFPEMARSITDAGAQVLLAPSSWVPGPDKRDQWNVLTRARAMDNGVFVVAVSQAEPVSIGSSLVADPIGAVLAQCGGGAMSQTIDLPLERVAEVRRLFPLAQQRRL
ncbi:carbon-nitrogen hydrolase family protein [Arthrobacter monumenti]